MRSATLRSTQTVEFDLVAVEDLLTAATPMLVGPRGQDSRPQLVVIDAEVEARFGARLQQSFANAGVRTEVVTIPGGEATKSVEQVLALISRFNDFGVRRTSEPLIAIGGGAVLDTVAAAASLYRRGVPHVRVPTTLLSMVDVSVAAKTAVNYEGFRNRIGTFHAPVRTVIDLAFLETVTDDDLSHGLGEVIKLAIVEDKSLFELLERGGSNLPAALRVDLEYASEVVWQSATRMLALLQDNLWERELRRSVDFGHTFSPLIEMRSGLHHGQAVALDCLLSCEIARRRGHLLDSQRARIYRLVASAGLATWHPDFSDPDKLRAALSDTVVHRNGAQHLPVPSGIGQHVFLEDLSDEELREAAAAFDVAGFGSASSVPAFL